MPLIFDELLAPEQPAAGTKPTTGTKPAKSKLIFDELLAPDPSAAGSSAGLPAASNELDAAVERAEEAERQRRARVPAPVQSKSRTEGAYEVTGTSPVAEGAKGFVRGAGEGIAEAGRQIAAGVVLDAPRMVTQSAQSALATAGAIKDQTDKSRLLRTAVRMAVPAVDALGLIDKNTGARRALAKGEAAVKRAEERATWDDPTIEGIAGIPASALRSLAPNLAANLATAGGASLVTPAVYGGSRGKEVYDKMIAAGRSESDARQAGILAAALEGGTEALSSLFGGNKAIRETVQAAGGAKNVTVPLRKFIIEKLTEMGAEGLQEFAQEGGGAEIERAYGLRPGETVVDSLEQGLLAAGAGAMAAGMAGAPQALDYRRSRAAARVPPPMPKVLPTGAPTPAGAVDIPSPERAASVVPPPLPQMTIDLGDGEVAVVPPEIAPQIEAMVAKGEADGVAPEAVRAAALRVIQRWEAVRAQEQARQAVQTPAQGAAPGAAAVTPPAAQGAAAAAPDPTAFKPWAGVPQTPTEPADPYAFKPWTTIGQEPAPAVDAAPTAEPVPGAVTPAAAPETAAVETPPVTPAVEPPAAAAAKPSRTRIPARRKKPDVPAEAQARALVADEGGAASAVIAAVNAGRTPAVEVEAPTPAPVAEQQTADRVQPAPSAERPVVRYTVNGRGLLNNQALDRSKLTEDEEMEMDELLGLSLQQPSGVPSTATFWFTEEGVKKNERLLSLLRKAASGPVQAERAVFSGNPVWESDDGQVALDPAQVSAALAAPTPSAVRAPAPVRAANAEAPAAAPAPSRARAPKRVPSANAAEPSAQQPAEPALPGKGVQNSINRALQASEILRGKVDKKRYESAYQTLRTHATKLGIDVPALGTFFNADQYRRAANEVTMSIAKKYGGFPTEALRAKRDAVSPPAASAAPARGTAALTRSDVDTAAMLDRAAEARREAEANQRRANAPAPSANTASTLVNVSYADADGRDRSIAVMRQDIERFTRSIENNGGTVEMVDGKWVKPPPAEPEPTPATAFTEAEMFPEARGKTPTLDRVRARIAETEKQLESAEDTNPAPAPWGDEVTMLEERLARLQELAGRIETQRIGEMRAQPETAAATTATADDAPFSHPDAPTTAPTVGPNIEAEIADLKQSDVQALEAVSTAMDEENRAKEKLKKLERGWNTQDRVAAAKRALDRMTANYKKASDARDATQEQLRERQEARDYQTAEPFNQWLWKMREAWRVLQKRGDKDAATKLREAIKEEVLARWRSGLIANGKTESQADDVLRHFSARTDMAFSSPLDRSNAISHLPEWTAKQYDSVTATEKANAEMATLKYRGYQKPRVNGFSPTLEEIAKQLEDARRVDAEIRAAEEEVEKAKKRQDKRDQREQLSQAAELQNTGKLAWVYRANSKTWTPVEGTPVKLDNAPQADLRVHRLSWPVQGYEGAKWGVTEQTTGMLIGAGGTKANAVQVARERIDKFGVDVFNEKVASVASKLPPKPTLPAASADGAPTVQAARGDTQAAAAVDSQQGGMTDAELDTEVRRVSETLSAKRGRKIDLRRVDGRSLGIPEAALDLLRETEDTFGKRVVLVRQETDGQPATQAAAAADADALPLRTPLTRATFDATLADAAGDVPFVGENVTAGRYDDASADGAFWRMLEEVGAGQAARTTTIETLAEAEALVEGMRRVETGDEVSGLTVRKGISNTGSIRASMEQYRVMGVREVPMSLFSGRPGEQRLADAISESGEIEPLIVVIDGHEDGAAYILEGAHRFDALRTLGVQSFPALVVVDQDGKLAPRFYRSRNGKIRAITYGTRSHFFLDRYDNASQLREDMLEEAGHRLVNEIGGDEFTAIGEQTYEGEWGDIADEITRNYGFAPGTPGFNHELVAKAFRDGKQNVGLWRRFVDAVVAAFRRVARRLGRPMTMADAEVRDYLNRMLAAKARARNYAATTDTEGEREDESRWHEAGWWSERDGQKRSSPSRSVLQGWERTLGNLRRGRGAGETDSGGKGNQGPRADDAAEMADGQVSETDGRAQAAQTFRNGAVTPEMDAAYAAAVERGDVEAAQRMVDEAAKAAGYNVGPVWHGTNADFTVFDKSKIFGRVFGEGFYFVDSEDVAGGFGNKLMRVFLRTPRVRVLSMENGEITPRYVSGPKYDAADSVEIRQKDAPTLYMVKDASAIKSADAITRDDAGRVIPLSERFNPATPDIRFARARVAPDATAKRPVPGVRIPPRVPANRQQYVGDIKGAVKAGETRTVRSTKEALRIIGQRAREARAAERDANRSEYRAGNVNMPQPLSVARMTAEAAQTAKDRREAGFRAVGAILKDAAKLAATGERVAAAGIKEIQARFAKVVRDSIRNGDLRASMLTRMAKVQTADDLEAALPDIAEYAEQAEKLHIADEIKQAYTRWRDSGSVAVEYQTRIDEIMEPYLTRGISDARRARLDETLAFIRREEAAGRSPGVPVHVIQRMADLTKTPLRDLSMAQLVTLQNDLGLLVQLGKLKLRARRNKMEMEKERAKASLIPSLTKTLVEYVKSRSDTGGGTTRERMQNWAADKRREASWLRRTLSPVASVLSQWDGDPDGRGALMREVYYPTQTDYGNYMRNDADFKDELRGVVKRLKLTPHDVEIVGIHAALEQDTGRQKLLNAYPGKKGEEFINRVEAEGMTDAQRAFLNWGRAKMDALWPRIEEIARIYYNTKLTKEDLYSPFLTDYRWQQGNVGVVSGLSGLLDQAASDFISDAMTAQDTISNSRTTRTEKQFTRERVGAGGQAIKTNFIEVLLQHTGAVHYHIAMEPRLRALSKLAADKEFQAAMGPERLEYFRDWMDTVARRGGMGAAHHIAWLDKIRANLGAAMLAGKPSTMAVQASQFIIGMAENGVEHQMRALGMFTSNKEMRDFIKDASPAVRLRMGQDEVIAEASVKSRLRKAASIGMLPAVKIDRAAAQVTWLGAYMKEIERKGGTFDMKNALDNDAARYADMIVTRTNASSLPIDVPQALSRGTLTGGNVSLSKTLTMFQTPLFYMTDNFARHGVGNLLRDPQKGLTILFFMLMASVYEAAVRRAYRWVTSTEDQKARRAGGEKYLNTKLQDVFESWGADNGKFIADMIAETMEQAVGNIPMLGSFPRVARGTSSGVMPLDALGTMMQGARIGWSGKRPEGRTAGWIRAATGAASFYGVPGTSTAGQLAARVMSSRGGSGARMPRPVPPRAPRPPSAP